MDDDGDCKLGLGCSIFLSHSGTDKDFVRFLNEALCHIGYRVFYDEQILPKAVQVSMRNIRAELKDAKLAVLVLSNAFFTRTQHPMNELSTIVEAGIQMLPVFYEFSVDAFKTKCRNQAWLTTWNRWVDEEVVSNDIIRHWEDALQAVSGTFGIEYCKEATNSLELRNKIVDRVCQIVKPDIRWSADGVQGMDRLCQDNLRIAKALMANNEKLFSIIDQMHHNDDEIALPVRVRKRSFFSLLSQLLYGLWVEADCSLHECSPACAGTQMQLLQECLQGLLSSKTLISGLLGTIPEYSWDEVDPYEYYWDRGVDPCQAFFRCAYESLVVVCCASIQKFEVVLDEEDYELSKKLVDSFFRRWEELQYRRLPLLLCDTDQPVLIEEGFRISSEMLIEHDLSAVRVADAVCRLKQFMEPHPSIVKLDEQVKKMYGTYHSRASAMKLHSHSITKQWHHPVGCHCMLRRWPLNLVRMHHHRDFSALGIDTINMLCRYGQLQCAGVMTTS